MENLVRNNELTACFDELNRREQLKLALNKAENENSQLKELVVRLSETVLKLVTRDAGS